MITQEKAEMLLETNAPISPVYTSRRYQFVEMRAEGLDNEEIAENLNEDLDTINTIELDIEEEFLK